MNSARITPWQLALGILVCLSVACSATSFIPSMPDLPSFPPTPSMKNVPTGPSPLSGDWYVKTDFGYFAFTVDPNGKQITTSVIQLDGYTCGGSTISTSMQILNSWALDNGEFSASTRVGSDDFETLGIQGKYDARKKAFSGIWDEDISGTHCTGKWESIPRK